MQYVHANHTPVALSSLLLPKGSTRFKQELARHYVETRAKAFATFAVLGMW